MDRVNEFLQAHPITDDAGILGLAILAAAAVVVVVVAVALLVRRT